MPEGIQQPALPRIWEGEPTNHAQLMDLYTKASTGEVTVHLVSLEGLKRVCVVFTKSMEADRDSYAPPTSEDAMQFVAARKKIPVEKLRYTGALVGEQVTHAKEKARERLRQQAGDIQASRR